MGDKDLDCLILRTLIIDGEVFIRVDRQAKNPFGLSFQVLDSLQIDFTKNQVAVPGGQNAITMGIEIDKDYRPIKYYFREGDVKNYQVGKTIEIPADEIIHIYRHEFVGQVRGFPEICASMDSLKQLDDYAVAELFAAKIAACQNVFYERTGSTAGDWVDQNTSDIEEPGTFINELSPRREFDRSTGLHSQKYFTEPSEHKFLWIRESDHQKNSILYWSVL